MLPLQEQSCCVKNFHNRSAIHLVLCVGLKQQFPAYMTTCGALKIHTAALHLKGNWPANPSGEMQRQCCELSYLHTSLQVSQSCKGRKTEPNPSCRALLYPRGDGRRCSVMVWREALLEKVIWVDAVFWRNIPHSWCLPFLNLLLTLPWQDRLKMEKIQEKLHRSSLKSSRILERANWCTHFSWTLWNTGQADNFSQSKIKTLSIQQCGVPVTSVFGIVSKGVTDVL